MYKTESNFPQINLFCESFIKDMKKIQTDLQSRSFKLYYHINNSFLPKFTPTINFNLYLNFGNADFGLHGVYHVTINVTNIFFGGII